MFLYEEDAYAPAAPPTDGRKTLRDYQAEAIAAIERDFAAGTQKGLLVLATGLGKGHPLDTEVPTPTGWRTWGDLKIGDALFGRDGGPVQVTGIFDRGDLPAYRVTFSDESSVIVDGDHLWTVRDSSKSYRPWATMKTSLLFQHSLKRERGWRFHIPMGGQARYDAVTSLPLAPYVVGALISNGSMTGDGTQLTTPDNEVASRCSESTTVNRVNDQTPGICPRYQLPGLTKITTELGMRVGSKEKRIPSQYLTTTIENRVALLHGLMDGDGSNRDESRRSVSYFTSSSGLACDVTELVNSLGGTAIIKKYDRGEKGIEYAVRILLPSCVDAFGTVRKKNGHGGKTERNLQPKRAIVSIAPVGMRQIRCIAVDAPDRLYQVTRQYIVTHNTVVFARLAADWRDGNVLILAHRVELLDQAADKLQSEIGYRPPIEQGERGLDCDDVQVGGNIVVGSVQTCKNMKRMEKYRQHPFSLVILDECHHATAASYRRIMDACLEFNPDCKFLGVTATPNRTDKAALGMVFDKTAYVLNILHGIDRGYLVPVRQESIYLPEDAVDFSNVTMTRNKFGEADFDRTTLESVLTEEGPLHAMAKPILDRCVGQSLVFTAGVTHAHLLAKVLNRYRPGCAAAIDGKTEDRQREHFVKEFKDGKIQYLTNYGIFTEGFDVPETSTVVMGRPTKSISLFTQMLGRGTRPLAGVVDGLPDAAARKKAIAASAKPYCVVMDFVGNTRHRPASCVDALGGDYDVEVRELAADMAAKGDRGEVRELLEKARKAAILGQLREFDAALAKAEDARKRIVARNVRYEVRQLQSWDDQGDVGNNVETPRGGATEKQVALLVGLGVAYATAAGYGKKQAGAVIDKLRGERCTVKQANILRQFGHEPAGINMQQASVIIDQIKARGWK